ncbi:MAG: ribokinase [Blautia sp.]|nr:ribokinase [Blautia sp.]
MKVLNFGSLNVDYVYSLQHIVQAGETILSSGMNVFAGGKGLNQSIALAKAGLDVYHAGQIGNDGQILLDTCTQYGVHTDFVKQLDVKGGHTIIQVDEKGQNCIILYGGTNLMLTREFVDEVLSHFKEGDYLVLQNEVNQLNYMIDKAYERGMKIALNPSPYDSRLNECDLAKVSLFLLNEVEGEQMTGSADPDEILVRLAKLYPNASFVLTLGSNGAVFSDGTEKYFQDIFKVKAVDTTAAGDTFTGYFIAGLIEEMPVPEILRMSAKASSIAVSRPGAAPSVPTREEVMESLK